jgi:hypothetical protein
MSPWPISCAALRDKRSSSARIASLGSVASAAAAAASSSSRCREGGGGSETGAGRLASDNSDAESDGSTEGGSFFKMMRRSFPAPTDVASIPNDSARAWTCARSEAVEPAINHMMHRSMRDTKVQKRHIHDRVGGKASSVSADFANRTTASTNCSPFEETLNAITCDTLVTHFVKEMREPTTSSSGYLLMRVKTQHRTEPDRHEHAPKR